MNGKITIKTLLIAATAYIAVATGATPALWNAHGAYTPPPEPRDSGAVDVGEPYDSTAYRYLPGEVRDTVALFEELEAKERLRMHHTHDIRLLTRTYGDSIVLRWSAPDYVSWRYMNNVGVDVYRINRDNATIDTLAHGLKPTPLDVFRMYYPETDSIAQMGIGTIYNLNRSNPAAGPGETDGPGALFDLHEDQMMQLGFAILASEWRPDVANHMAMRWVDTRVKRGQHYTYSIVPTVTDTTRTIVINAGVADDIENTPYKPEPFDIVIRDSVSPPNSVMLWWEDRNYSSFEIERRMKGETRWKRVNVQPYVVMLSGTESDQCYYGDNVPKPGYYEYRIVAHDAFGEDHTSPTHSVAVGDMEAPRAPEITWIEIIRPNEDDPSAEIWAEIHFEKDTMEADYVGALPMYYHGRATEGKWKALLDKPLAPTDTVCRIDVTNLPTGDVVMAAYDTAHNVGYSIPQLLRVSDMRPPKAPTGLKATTSAKDGTITLTWDAMHDDDIDYYEIVFANDTTHQFMQLKGAQTRDTMYVDTVSMEANQKYIYYRVRGVDFSTNMGEYSKTLQVIRPSNVPPSVAHIDSAHVSGKGIYMRWVAGNDELMAYHHVLRRLESQKEWTLLRRCDADSVKACHDFIELIDVPDASVREPWVYAIESFNYSDISSGLSLQYVVSFTGETVFPWTINLQGAYIEKDGETRLAWEMPSGNPPYSGEWYFCIYRKGAGDQLPQFLLSAQPEERTFNDFILQPGEQADYYIMIQYADGRSSEPSNTITVTAPKKD